MSARAFTLADAASAGPLPAPTAEPDREGAGGGKQREDVT
jgi:hypothetical protein